MTTEKKGSQAALEALLKRFSFRVYYRDDDGWCGSCDQYVEEDCWEQCQTETPADALRLAIAKTVEIAAQEKEDPEDQVPESLRYHVMNLSLEAQLDLLSDFIQSVLSAHGDEALIRRKLRESARMLANYCVDDSDPFLMLPVLLYDVEDGLVCAHAVELDVSARGSSDAKAIRALQRELLRVFVDGRYDLDASRIPCVPRPEIAARYARARELMIKNLEGSDRMTTIDIPTDREILGHLARLAGDEAGAPGPYGYQKAKRVRPKDEAL
jgi:hypothetical protein